MKVFTLPLLRCEGVAVAIGAHHGAGGVNPQCHGRRRSLNVQGRRLFALQGFEKRVCVDRARPRTHHTDAWNNFASNGLRDRSISWGRVRNSGSMNSIRGASQGRATPRPDETTPAGTTRHDQLASSAWGRGGQHDWVVLRKASINSASTSDRPGVCSVLGRSLVVVHHDIAKGRARRTHGPKKNRGG